MMLGRTYEDVDYEEAITLVGLCHKERQREFEHEKKFHTVQSKKNQVRETRFPSLSIQFIDAIGISHMTRD
jgi:hypothetical protein